jgi:hypothetical protein
MRKLLASVKMTNTAWHEGDAIDEGVILVQVDPCGLDDRRDSRRVQKENLLTVNGSERFSTNVFMCEIT